MQGPSSRREYGKRSVSRVSYHTSIVATVLSLVLIPIASIGFGWLTAVRAIYLLLGIAEGLLIGLFESSIITKKLAKKKITMAEYWLGQVIFIFLASQIIFAACFFCRYWPTSDCLYSELAALLIFLVLPLIAVSEAMSSRRLIEFEEKLKVQICSDGIRYRLWKEPIDKSGKFAPLIDSIISKDYSFIFPLADYSEYLVRQMKGMSKVEPQARDFLSKLLEMIKAYRRQLGRIAVIFIVSMLCLPVYFLAFAATNAFGLLKVVGGKIVEGQTILLVLVIVPFVSLFGGAVAAVKVLNRKYREKFSTLVTSLNPDVISNLRSLTKE